ncbi:phosphopantetheine-binding protein [Streptomyces sp. NPDC000351]|uniref:acyl carrier protein n=1 Tax=Streptomyces sp. NPDC000351 TaxID=3154250 RepID=UPI003317A646
MTGQRLEVRDTVPSALTDHHAGLAVPPEPGTEETLARLLADVAHVDEVPLDGHFFNDLGADSLLMAHFCARVRKRPDLPSVSMRDIYRHPTINELTAALADTAATAPAPGTTATQKPGRGAPAPTGRPHHVLRGALQLLGYLGYTLLLAFVGARGYDWISAGTGLLDSCLRSVAFGAVLLVVLCALPVIAKWLLIGRWTPQRFRVWSLAYLRFWLVKALILRAGMQVGGLLPGTVGLRVLPPGDPAESRRGRDGSGQRQPEDLLPPPVTYPGPRTPRAVRRLRTLLPYG